MSQEESDLAENIVQDTLPQHTQPARDDFEPWHKVRKQFIRERQWNMLIRRMVQHLGQQLAREAVDWSLDDEGTSSQEPQIPEAIQHDKHLKCLVIPADDLLDLRSLWKEIRDENCFIRYLGFNEGRGSDQEGTRLYVSNNEVTSLSHVLPDSQVLRDRFQSIANQNSPAYHYLKKYGPFHVVNLDICDSLFPTTTGDRTSYYRAVHRLAEFQMRHQTTPWLLFVTTQVEPGMVRTSELQQMCQPTRRNCEAHPDFVRRLDSIVPATAFQTEGVAVDLSTLDEGQLMSLFGVAFGKWLMDLAGSASPDWFIDVHPCYRYGIRRNPRVDMLSLAFLFRPKIYPPIDTTGLSTLNIVAPRFPGELECAIKLVSAVENIADVDALLSSDEELRLSMETASAELLESAGYDRQKYLNWAERYYDGRV